MDTQHSQNRTQSALNRLRRTKSRVHVDDDFASETGSTGSLSLASTATGAQSGASMAYQNPPGHGHGQGSRASNSMAGLTNTSPQPASGHKSKGSTSSSSQSGISIEQSVKKFRIFEALRNGDTASISKSIRENTQGGSPGSPSSVNQALGGRLEDTTILHLAVQCASQQVVEYVLSDGAGSIDINARDRDGNTPIHVAASQGRGQIVRLLLEQKGINDSISNYQGKVPLDLARTPDIFQQLQLSRSIFVDGKIKEIQGLIAKGDYKTLGEVLEEPRVKTVLDVNGGEFASDITTIQSGGTLLHEAARRRNTQLIQTLLLHGADPFTRDRRGKLPQDVTKDETTRAILKRSPAAHAAQRGIQEKAVLGNANTQGSHAPAPGDALAGKESREMKGFLKKWTNYRKGYQLRWFVLEDGVLSYYKHQEDAGSACRGAINMRIAQLHMDPTEKQKFEIIGKSSVKYSLKANHEVEAKRWFWALNNSIQWTKDKTKAEEEHKAKSAELLRQAKAEQEEKGAARDGSTSELTADCDPEARRNSQHSARPLHTPSASRSANMRVNFTNASNPGSLGEEDDMTAFGSYEHSFMGGEMHRVTSNLAPTNIEDDDDDYGDESSSRDAPAIKDAFDITAQSAKVQVDVMGQLYAALHAERVKDPTLPLSDPSFVQAISAFDGSIRSLKGLLGDLMRISKDRDMYWQRRLDREADMRQMWEDSMAKIAREQEVLEARVGEAEEKRKKAKRVLREVIEATSQPGSGDELDGDPFEEALEGITLDGGDLNFRRRKSTLGSLRRKSILAEMPGLSDSESEVDEEFFDAVDAGEVKAVAMPSSIEDEIETSEGQGKEIVSAEGLDISSSFHGYEDGIRKRLRMDADDRPKISLWSILKSMIGKDMTKMTLPVSFNEPTSLLQRCAEDMEYTDLLDIAASRTDSTERMVYVSAFAASEYASTIGRVAKPFNPLLGETFEYARPDKKYRFFIEQVSHHPPIGAAWAESPHWTYYGESAVKSKFYGKSFDINPLGTWFLKLRPTNGAKEELYTWKKVTSSVIGIITGSPTVDNYGTMEIKNWTTGEVCVIEFKPRGWTSSSAYQVSGRVNDARGQPRFSMGGRWNHKIYARLTPGYEAAIDEPKSGKSLRRGSVSEPNQVFTVWEANARPSGIPFNLTPFVVTLNALPERLQPYLPPTDTRLRPDQRAMEDGEYDLAAVEKNRVEEKQRKRRREREAKGEEFEPMWYSKARCEITGEEYWKFNGRYWEERERAGRDESPKWQGVEDIF
ncbi:MAG: hypothetical protein M1818_007616 [Claussenomyces sp. TS43310]|nr:MAG: hypothetical protein M1818_007616 [Claussenomyces sp. TS43310]